MPTYIVQDTHIKHGAKGAREAVLYGPGDAIDLSPKEAEALGSNVVPAPEAKGAKKAPKAAQGGPPAEDGPAVASGAESPTAATSGPKTGKKAIKE